MCVAFFSYYEFMRSPKAVGERLHIFSPSVFFKNVEMSPGIFLVKLIEPDPPFWLIKLTVFWLKFFKQRFKSINGMYVRDAHFKKFFIRLSWLKHAALLILPFSEEVTQF